MSETLKITDPDSDRYHTFGYISWWQQEVVREASALVVGAGALGNEVLKNLALMGFGKLLIVDFDTIEDSNLSRSVLFRESDRGRRKVDAAAQRVKELNPDVQVQAWHGDINY
ncbi:MAG: HesA/MoeB/ThiF family protein, partial [Candidatus Promineifilaceae bacterium]